MLAWLKKRHGLLDAVVISGGEPTLQPGFAGFMAEVRSLGYLVKLDTNGTHPEVLATLLSKHLLDYVAMDIKAPPNKYDAICGVPVDQTAIDASIAQLIRGGVDHHFRTTLIPQLTPKDIQRIANRIHGARAHVLQPYRNNIREDLSIHAIAGIRKHDTEVPVALSKEAAEMHHAFGVLVNAT